MCTAVTYKTKDFYFGRTLDYEYSYEEGVTITPRNYPFKFRNKETINKHYAIIGMAYVTENYPLYYDAINEKGLGMAGLNFVGNAYYNEMQQNKDNIAQFEFIPWILSQCVTVKEAKILIEKINLINIPFNEQLPLAQLHWIISDAEESITVEAVKEGIKIYDNPVGVLTNNPPFDKQIFALNNYINLSNKSPKNEFATNIELQQYSRGMGAIGLPGDLSSQSRFVRASFVKMNSVSGEDENESVSQFFHILNSVDQQRGCCQLEDEKYEITIYTSCCNATKGIYYYTTYDNHQITAVDMNKENLDGNELIRYLLIKGEHINYQNEYPVDVENLKKKSERYYDNTESDIPKKNVKYFVENIKITPGKAIDIGCGAGNDSIYLIKNGWNVTSVDKENVEERISKRLNSEEEKRFKFQKQNFEDMKLEETDLIVANYSLPFCKNEQINDVWRNIVNKIKQNGYFVGNFFGINDSWNKTESSITFLTKEQVLNFFDKFDIIKFNEIEKDGLTGLGNMKHLHIFNVIAKKK